jgi:hypothetical protein
MSVRETIDSHRNVVTAIALVILACGAYLIFHSSAGPSSQTLMARAYYTIDDGASWFVDDAQKVPPFAHQGKTAVRVRMFSSNGGETLFPGYLERYTEDARRRIAAAQRGDSQAAGMQTGRTLVSLMEELLVSGTEVKKPGPTGTWVRRSDLQAAAPVLDVRSPDGSVAQLALP